MHGAQETVGGPELATWAGGRLSGGKEPLLEVHFFDFDKDIYGQRLEVQFVAKLRDELNFESIDDLVVQMKRDEAQARACLAQLTMPED